MSTPPGWYPDPAQPPNSPPQERWWDGGTWTQQSRPALPPGSPPPYAPSPYAPQPERASRRAPMIAMITGAAVLVAALLVGTVLFFLPGGTDDEAGGGKPGPGSSEDGEGQPGRRDTGVDPDPARGVRLPVPEGWEPSEDLDGIAVSSGEYTCPGGDGKRCVRGSSLVIEATTQGDLAEVAKRDIRENAARSYSTETFGGITSHSVITSGRTKIAGKIGYRVRWKIENKLNPDGYVESVAFPHPDGSGQILVVRSSIDLHADSPPLSDLSRIIAGLREGDGGPSGDGPDDDGSSEAV